MLGPQNSRAHHSQLQHQQQQQHPQVVDASKPAINGFHTNQRDHHRRRYAQTLSRTMNLTHHQQQPRGLTDGSATMRLQSHQHLKPQVTSYFYDYPSISMTHEPPLLPHSGHPIQPLYPQPPRPMYLAYESAAGILDKHSLLNKPLCRCRVMYLGSSVPHITKNGLHGIQEPLKQLYPEEQFGPPTDSSSKPMTTLPATGPSKPPSLKADSNTIDISHLSSSLGIDSWLSVWSNGLLLENVDEFGRDVKRFFSIESLHYCAAVRFFDTSKLMTEQQQQQQQQNLASDQNESIGDPNNNTIGQQVESAQDSMTANGTQEHRLSLTSAMSNVQRHSGGQQKKSMVRFLPLDAPLFQCPGMVDANHPPVFAAIIRRTTGIKVLECHAFICRRDAAANALVRCCTHAYADFLNAKRLSLELGQKMDPNSSDVRLLGGSVYRGSDTSVRPTSTGDGTAGRSRVSGDKIRGNKATRLPNLSTSTSANTTSNEENSLENSSEDNYAVISKRGQHQFQHDFVMRDARKLGDNNNVQVTKRSRREPNKSGDRRYSKDNIKRSSRSLFDDFMPKSSSPQPSATHSRNEVRKSSEIDKLSYSLDHLQVAACCENLGDVNGDVGRFVVTDKRHSRSMQNLDGPFQFTAPSSTRSRSPKTRRHRHKSRQLEASNANSSGMDDGGIEAKSYRKATSYQDMLVLRKGSDGSDVTANQSSSGESNYRKKQAAGQQRSSGLQSLQRDNSEIITDHSNSSMPQNGMVSSYRPQAVGIFPRDPRYSIDHRDSYLSDQYLIDNQLQGSISSSSKSKKSSSKRREQSCPPRCRRRVELERTYDSVVPATLAPNHHQQQAKSYYQYQPSFSPAIYAPHPLAYPPPPPPLPPYLAHHQQQHNPYQSAYLHPFYGPQIPLLPHPASQTTNPCAIYDPPALGAYLNGAMQQLYSKSHNLTDQQQQHQQQQYPQLNAPTRLYANGASGSHTLASARKSQPKSSKSTLARFRCLSPPVNFLAAASAANPRDSCASVSSASKQAAVAEQTTIPASPSCAKSNQAVKVSTNDDRTGAMGSRAAGESDVGGSCTDRNSSGEEMDIITAEPGFISHTTASGATLGRHKKVSWIKRLSLTMSAGSGDDSNSVIANGAGATGSLSTDPNGAGRRKKRSGFFAGSLTLGRSNKQQTARLITSPT